MEKLCQDLRVVKSQWSVGLWLKIALLLLGGLPERATGGELAAGLAMHWPVDKRKSSVRRCTEIELDSDRRRPDRRRRVARVKM